MNIIKRNAGRLLTVLSLALAGASCSDWLDVSPESEVKYDDLFSYKNGFKDQLTGIYTNLCDENMYGAHLSFGMVDALGQYYWPQPSGQYYPVHRYEYSSGTCQSLFSTVWSGLYNAIANVNILIQGIEEHRGVMSPAEEAIYEGEAYGLRAMLHLDALRLFGKSWKAGASEKAIPYVTTVSGEVTPMSTTAEAIDKVIADLKHAAELLADDPIRTGAATTAFLGTRRFHLNYYGVKSLLGRAYLYKNDKAGALECAREVIAADDIFPWVAASAVTTGTAAARDRLFSTECIFMLNNTHLNELSEKYFTLSNGAVSSNTLEIDWDTRYPIFDEDYSFDWRSIYLIEDASRYMFISNKLRQLNTNYNNRQPMIRKTEMYLVAAECAADKKEAVGYINTLRLHRGYDAGKNLDESVSDETLSNIIEMEFRKEFVCEGQYFYFLKRTDSETMPQVRVPFSKSYYVLPVPDQELEYGNR